MLLSTSGRFVHALMQLIATAISLSINKFLGSERLMSINNDEHTKMRGIHPAAAAPIMF